MKWAVCYIMFLLPWCLPALLLTWWARANQPQVETSETMSQNDLPYCKLFIRECTSRFLFYFLKDKEKWGSQLWNSKKRFPLLRASGLPGSGNQGRGSTRERMVFTVWLGQDVKSGTLSSHNMSQRHLSTFCRSLGVPHPPSIASVDCLSQSSACPPV